MRILVVSPYLPSRHSGSPVRLHGLVNVLAASHTVSLLSFAPPDQEHARAVAALRTYCAEVKTVTNDLISLAGSAKRALQLRSLLSRKSFLRLVHDRPSLHAELLRMTERSSYDVVQVEHSFMVNYASPPSAPVVLDEHNIEYEIPRRTAQVARALPRKIYDHLEYLKLMAEEEGAWRRVDACAVTSSRDEAIIRQAFPEARTAVVPNAVDTQYFSPGTSPPDRSTVLFFGTISVYPNVDALLFFLREVMPLLKRSHPLLQLLIVGPAPPPAILRWAGPDVIITGAVADLRPFLERATVVIAPLRMGGGTRLKILEAMAMGKPVVSTTLGAEGLDVQDGNEILLADTAPTFAAQVARLLDDGDLAASLGYAGRRLIETKYDWRASALKLEALYRIAIQAHAGASAERNRSAVVRQAGARS